MKEDDYENTHVHAVYSQIAVHFAQTRHKAWPLIAQFLTELPAGSVGLDVGCGNGKYLDVNADVLILGSDRTPELVDIARAEKVVKGSRHADVLVGDILNLPHPNGRYDFAISVAVIHHLSSRERRVLAIRDMLALLRPGDDGRLLLYVWALEQKSSRRGWDEGGEQDLMVPWVRKDQTFERYYHLYKRGELEADVIQAGGRVLKAGYEKDNWWVIAMTNLHPLIAFKNRGQHTRNDHGGKAI